MPYRAVVFDAYGTLYDAQSVNVVVAQECGERASLVTQLWRLKQLEYSWLRALMGAYEDFWSVTRAALDFALEACGVGATPAMVERMMAKYLALDLYPEASAALGALVGCRRAILSNGSPAMLKALVENSGVASLFDTVISVDAARTYKPDPRCYALVPTALGIAKEEVLFVSSNGFDVAGAKRFGFAVAWIERGGAPAASADISPARLFGLQRGRAERLGRDADFRIASLTEVAVLVSGGAGRG